MPFDLDKAKAELPVLKEFIKFVNKQVGVYMDCLSGFEGNQIRMHRQIPRAQHPTGRRIENGQPVIIYTSVEDPERPDIVHNRIIRADEYLSDNAERGFNEQQICWSIICFIYSNWDEVVRPQIASIRGVQPNDVRVQELGELRIIRNCIVHSEGLLSERVYSSLKIFSEIFKPGQKISPSHDQMHKIFILIKQSIAKIILEYAGHLPGAPDPSHIVDIAIQN